ncbi:hypothetical protein [Haloplanus sp. C73]|uniref:hypothetical protein n=1 Tax=Haloplanus sp. C73 TaxID=3421641 RepID=UPI003EB79F79
MSPSPSTRPWSPLVTEFALVGGLLVGVTLWYRLVGRLLRVVGSGSSLLRDGALFGTLFLGGLVVGAAVYVAARHVHVGLARPAWSERWTLAAAGAVPAVLVACTKLVGVVTGVPYNSLTLTAVAASPPLGPIVALSALTLAVRVPALVVVSQVLIQGSFERAGGDALAAVATTLVTAFALVDTTGTVAPAPDVGKLAALVALMGALVVYRAVATRTDRRRVRFLAAIPFVAGLGVVALAAVVSVTSVAGALFALTQVATFGVAAEAYRRTDSLVSPALAYACLLVANRVVVVSEAGAQAW